jgi:hypothetical protein
MRTWVVVLAAAFGTLIAEGAWLWPALAAAPLSHLVPTLLSHLPVLGPAAVLLFAFVVLVLTTAMVINDSERVRSRLARSASPTRPEWEDAFAATALSGLETRLLDLAPQDGRLGSSSLVLSGRFDAGSARREIGRQFSRHLARAQFFTALALSLAIASLGWMVNLGYLPAFPVAIPAAATAAAAAALAVFAVIARGIVTIAAEPLLDTISAFPFARIESELLRRIAALAQAGSTGRLGTEPAPSSAIAPLLERLSAAIDEERRLLLEAIANLAQHAEALALAARSIAERSAEGGASELRSADSAALRAAIGQLAESVEKLAAAQGPPASGEGEASRADAPAAPSSGLGRELRRLIAELK